MGEYVSYAGQCDAHMNRNKTKQKLAAIQAAVQTKYTREHAQWTLEKALEMPKNTMASISYALHYSVCTAYVEAHTHSSVWWMDGGLGYCIESSKPRNAYAQHTHQNSVNALHAGIECVMSGTEKTEKTEEIKRG